MLQALAEECHIVLENVRALGFDWEICSFCDNGDRYALFDCRVLRVQVKSLAGGIISIEREVMQRSDCMAAILWSPST